MVSKIHSFEKSQMIMVMKNIHTTWDNVHDDKVFMTKYLNMSSQKAYKNTMKLLCKKKDVIKEITGKNMFRRYKKNPDIGLSFKDIDECITNKEHANLNDKKCGNRLSNTLKRWIRYINFGDSELTLSEIPDHCIHHSHLECCYVLNNGNVCNRRCVANMPLCGIHKNTMSRRFATL